MKRYTKDGVDKLWFEPNEIEDIMSAELEMAKLMPSLDDPVVNLEAFVEFHLKVQFDQYATLPPNTLGETEFRIGPRIKISINKELTTAALPDDEMFALINQSSGSLGRYRATVAHEASHVI